jgi:hypothetical protein
MKQDISSTESCVPITNLPALEVVLKFHTCQGLISRITLQSGHHEQRDGDLMGDEVLARGNVKRDHCLDNFYASVSCFLLSLAFLLVRKTTYTQVKIS